MRSDRGGLGRTSFLVSATLGTASLLLVAVWSLPRLQADLPASAPALGSSAKSGNKQHGAFQAHYRDRLYIAPIGLNLRRCNREAVGALLGAGANAGSTVGRGDGRAIATISGATIGMLAGSAIGRNMDQADGYCVAQTLAHVEDGETVIWRNTKTDSEYHVTPERSYSNEAGEYCREYTAAATIGRSDETVRGAACLQSDGTWRLVG